ncbi:hypothetical protein B9Z55_019627 [Caenorhabditis nigoni]|uniref:Uncharacterized protein n=1 Tax=Caenorhabditis nigoni TaxID=1611254 RepID=A0A2G5TJ61_9PELO|nr:hypothetical protein B9Z55_019627 [Caenorhabditis nigoni]
MGGCPAVRVLICVDKCLNGNLYHIYISILKTWFRSERRMHALKDIFSKDISCGELQDPDSSDATFCNVALDEDGGWRCSTARQLPVIVEVEPSFLGVA